MAAAETAPSRADPILHSLTRLPELVKIRQPDNKIFVERLEIFKTSPRRGREEFPEFTLGSRRGRIFLNSSKLKPSAPAMNVTLAKLMENRESMGFHGFGFIKRRSS
ncbi:MAG: hypothetical protein LBR53_10445 [Deltaproteobacteria bacterium]|jgi:hypothetical protein|nr:hypothetical protein [Deltaproteobacteria bacterium]